MKLQKQIKNKHIKKSLSVYFSQIIYRHSRYLKMTKMHTNLNIVCYKKKKENEKECKLEEIYCCCFIVSEFKFNS